MAHWLGGDGAKPTRSLISQPLGSISASHFIPTTSDGITHTKTGVLFGTAQARRRMVACIALSGTDSLSFPSLSTFTIGGVTADIAVNNLYRNGTNFVWDIIACALVPTGTSGTVEYTFSSLLNVAATKEIGCIYRTTNLRSNIPFDTGTATAASGTVSDTVSVPAASVVIASYAERSFFGAITWSGLTQDDAGVSFVSGAAIGISVASDQPAANAGLSVSCGDTGGGMRAISIASFR